MKKMIGIIAAALALVTALAGCGSAGQAEEKPQPGTGGAETIGDDMPAPPEATPSREKAQGISIAPVTSARTQPADFGEWQETRVMNYDGGEVGTAYYRITGVRTGREAADAVAEKKERNPVVFEELGEYGFVYGVMEHDLYFPPEFPDGGTRIVANISFSLVAEEEEYYVVNRKDEKYAYAAPGFVFGGSTHTLADALQPGDVWQGETVFAYTKDYPDYIFMQEYDGTNGKEYTYVREKK